MDILLNLVRHVVIDDEIDTSDIQASSSHTCSNQHTASALFQVTQGNFTFFLLSVTVNTNE